MNRRPASPAPAPGTDKRATNAATFAQLYEALLAPIAALAASVESQTRIVHEVAAQQQAKQQPALEALAASVESQTRIVREVAAQQQPVLEAVTVSWLEARRTMRKFVRALYLSGEIAAYRREQAAMPVVVTARGPSRERRGTTRTRTRAPARDGPEEPEPAGGRHNLGLLLLALIARLPLPAPWRLELFLHLPAPLRRSAAEAIARDADAQRQGQQ